MNYQAQLNPWVIYRLSSDLQRELVTRFRTRNDAESYLKVMGQMQPHLSYMVVFEAPKPESSMDTSALASATSSCAIKQSNGPTGSKTTKATARGTKAKAVAAIA
ncbi:MAG: hypothetical protein NZ772_08755 [Cyanobacteria bacterium]|nr:hypothetical protein [Cyanobacteriota bacterium]MDW8200869.1 hypothetical protein [Cyanobacteriota bacterium SKYGB_h_bin112]